MAEVIQLAKPGQAPPAQGGFVMTETARDMLRSLQMVGSTLGGAITLIAGTPGIGKTKTLLHFKHEIMPRARIHTAVAGEGTPWGVACQLMHHFDMGTPNSRNLLDSRHRIAEEIGVDGLLIIDEAQYLVHRNPRGKDNWDALEWLRAMAEEGCFSLAFCGDSALLETADRLPQLWRRMIRRVIIKGASKADVEALVTRRGLNQDEVVDALYHVARRYGGLADVDNAITHACLLAGGQMPMKAHILAALEDLNLFHRGAKTNV